MKRTMIETDHPTLSIRRQCQLLDLNRATYYWQPARESALNRELMRLIDREYTRAPFYGYRKMTARLKDEHGYRVNHKRVARLMQTMGLQAVYPRPRTSIADKQHKTYAYLLRDLDINRPNQVWAAYITYVPLPQGFMYLVAVMDWFSRFVDNIFVERLWRTVKYEDVYLKGHELVPAPAAGLDDYFQLYNYERPNQSLGYRTPADVHFAVAMPLL